MYTYDDISLNSLQGETFWDKCCRENQNTHFICNYFSKILPFRKQRKKQPYTPQMMIMMTIIIIIIFSFMPLLL